MRHIVFSSAVAIVLACSAATAADLPVARTLSAQDTLAPIDDPAEDARQCLAGIAWTPSSFQVQWEPAPGAEYDWLVRFPSPVTSGHPANDRVALEWYAPRDETGKPRRAPAVIVVHETGSQMLAGRLFARGLRAKGLHALMVELPFYGVRYGAGMPAGADTITLFRQGVADIRRARDAVAVLPHIQAESISLQGTSLGGIAAALAASIDGAFDRTFLTVAGGDLYELVQNGQREAGMFRRRLKQNGYTDQQLQELFWKIEPTRIAHRLNPKTTWLYSAEDDHVIPARHSEALAVAAGLPDDHQLVYPGNHYTVFFYFPKVLDHMVEQIPAE